jgi:hypothetical protein
MKQYHSIDANEPIKTAITLLTGQSVQDIYDNREQ